MERAARSLFALPPRCLKILTGQQDNTATRDPPGWPSFYRCEFLARPFDILPAMNGRDSYGVPAGFAGTSAFLPQPPYFSGGLPRGLTFGLSARRSFGREEYMPCRRERQSLTPA